MRKLLIAVVLVAAPVALAACHTSPYGACVHLDNGQATINANPAGTVYCVAAGVHQWTLQPKSGDVLYGDVGAVLDGGGSLAYAVTAGTADNVTVDRIEIRNYVPGDQEGAIRVTDKTGSVNWTLKNVHSHHNGANGNGNGTEMGDGWDIVGGSYHDNRQNGVGGDMGDGITINGADISWNNFTNDAHTTRSHSCGDEAGGVKWVADDVWIANSTISNNACKGLWSDLEAHNMVISGNTIENNWDEGIFIELSTKAVVANNVVRGNGFRNYNISGGNCANFPWAGGITISTSGQTHRSGVTADKIDVYGNTVEGNCNGITGVDQFRDEHECETAPRCDLRNVDVHDNDLVGSTAAGAGNMLGAGSDEGDNLADNNLDFTGNTYDARIDFCGVSC